MLSGVGVALVRVGRIKGFIGGYIGGEAEAKDREGK